MNLTTGANGVATYKFRLSRKDPTGTWQTQATSATNGVSGAGSNSFLVQ